MDSHRRARPAWPLVCCAVGVCVAATARAQSPNDDRDVPGAYAQEASPPAAVPGPKVPAEPPLSIGVTGDLGVFISGLTVGTGGVGVYGATGIGGVGGKIGYTSEVGMRVAVEGAVDWDLTGHFDSRWWWIGGGFDALRPLGGGRSAGGGIGIGYGEGDESVNEYHQAFIYFRPRVQTMQAAGPVAAGLGLYGMLPIVVQQRVEGRDVNLGWTPWAGIDLTFYVRFGGG